MTCRRSLVDANQLELALLNVALNARDAMPDGGSVKITARADSGAAAGVRERPLRALRMCAAWAPTVRPCRKGDYVRITIVDTGVGMDRVTLAKATEPFFTTKGPGKGTGLGLSMVQGLAAQSGGLLRIHSEPNAGTVVELWLPKATTAAAALVRSPDSAAAVPRNHRALHGAHRR